MDSVYLLSGLTREQTELNREREREGDRDVLGTEHEPSALSEHHGNHEQCMMSVYME